MGLFAADRSLIPLNENTLIIENSVNSDAEGNHWLFIFGKSGTYLIGDPTGLRLDAYKEVNKHLTCADFTSEESIQEPLQPPTPNLCGLYCIYIAQYVFSGYYPIIPLIDDERLIRLVKHLYKLYSSSLTLKLPNWQNIG